ncbi:MAG: methyltransferase family protein [Terriglobales bacterium]
MNSPLRDPGFTAPASASATGAFLAIHRKGWEYFGNGLLCLSAFIYNIIMLTDFMQKHRVSSLYVALFEAAVVFFSVTRPMPKETNGSLYDWMIALLGSYLIMLMRPAAAVHDHVALLVVQVAGMAISLTGLFSLNKSFGMVAANRGVKRGGLYRFIRHPIYAGYFLSFGAFLLQNITLLNVVIYVVFVALELLRIAAEERVLSRDPSYASYSLQTRWRILPLIY